MNKSDAGKKGRGVNSFVPKAKSTRDPGLAARIELVVQMAIASESIVSGQDVIRHNRLRLSFRAKGSKVG